MPTLSATVGDAAANSYITVADATTYFDERLHPQSAVWTDSSADDQARALITATRRLDQEEWQGYRVDSVQALDWPRYEAYDQSGEEYDSNEIPTDLKHAACELAMRVLLDYQASKDTFADTGLEEFRSAKVGPMDMERDPTFTAGQLPANVRGFVSHVLIGGSGSVRLRRA